MKQFHDEDAHVIGHKPGEGRLQGMMGALMVELSNGKELKIGTGFSGKLSGMQDPEFAFFLTFF